MSYFQCLHLQKFNLDWYGFRCDAAVLHAGTASYALAEPTREQSFIMVGLEFGKFESMVVHSLSWCVPQQDDG